MSAAIISGDRLMLSIIGPNMEAVPTKETVIDPVEIVKIAATKKGSIIPRTGNWLNTSTISF